MDAFGIGNMVKGALNVCFVGARRSGRTNALVDQLQDGDRVWFLDSREADRVRRLCKDRDIEIEARVCEPSRWMSVVEGPPSRGRTLFDHSWVEQFYLRAVRDAERAIDAWQTGTSAKDADEPPMLKRDDGRWPEFRRD